MGVFNSPQVKTSVSNYSGYVSASSSVVMGMVGAASMGPVNTPTLITSEANFVATFGPPALTNFGQAAAIQYLQQGSSLWYVRITDGQDTTASVNVPDTLTTPTTSFTVSGNSTGSNFNGWQVVISNVVTSTSPSTFTFQVLNASGLSVAIINNVSMYSSSSNYLPTLVSNGGYNFTITDPNNGSGTTPAAGTYTLAGGSNGDTNITDAQVIGTGSTGMQGFVNNELYPISVLATPGFVDDAVINAAITLCQNRGDCLYLCDTPQSLSVSEVISWSNGTGTYSSTMTAINNQYAAVYWPWVQYYDPYNGVNRWTPPSGWIAGVYAYNDSVAYPWDAPAGLTRGRLTQPIGIEYSASRADRDQLQGQGNIINPIINITNTGLVVWGQKTTLRQQNDLNRVNVVRLVNYLRSTLANVSLQLVFENNNLVTWSEWVGMVTPLLTQIQNEGGLYAFSVVMNSSTVTNADIQEHYLPGNIYLQPQLDAEYIDIGFVLEPTGVSFS